MTRISSCLLLLLLAVLHTTIATKQTLQHQLPRNVLHSNTHNNAASGIGKPHHLTAGHLKQIQEQGSHTLRYRSADKASELRSDQLKLNLTDLRHKDGPSFDNINWTDLRVAKTFSQRHRIVQKVVPANPTDPDPVSGSNRQPEKAQQEEPEGYTSNLEANNWLASQYYTKQYRFFSTQNSTKHVRCSIQRPFFNGKECQACPFQQFFDFDTNKCVRAPKGLTFDPNIHRFVKPTPQFITNLAAPRLDYSGLSKQQVTEEYDREIQRSGKQVCPKSTPFYDGVICVQCFEPYAIFNLVTKRCTRCADTQEYSNRSFGCFEKSKDGDLWTLPKALSNIFTGF